MNKLILLICSLVCLGILGCDPNGSTVVAPEGSTIILDPDTFTININAAMPVTTHDYFINVEVRDVNGNPKPLQELFFWCGVACDLGYVYLTDNHGNVIDTNVGDVHGVTDVNGNYYLWVHYVGGGGNTYTQTIRATSGMADAYHELNVGS